MNSCCDDSGGIDPEVVERLAEVFLYAPLGLLWEHQAVIDQLARRGKSQTQVVKLIAQIAAQQDPAMVEQQMAQTLEAAVRPLAKPLSRLLIEAGVLFGASPRPDRGPQDDADTVEPEVDEVDTVEPEVDEVDTVEPEVVEFPIQGYEDLTAREIIALLPALSPDEQQLVEARERDGRGRKTILGWLERHR